MRLTQTPLQQARSYGETNLAWPFARPQSCSRAGAQTESKNQAAATFAS